MRLSLGVFAAILCIASPALARYGSPSNSAHHGQHLSVSNHPSDSPALTSPPRDPRSWVGDPAGRPYVYVPGQASGGGGF
jgi:hypothetical protein